MTNAVLRYRVLPVVVATLVVIGLVWTLVRLASYDPTGGERAQAIALAQQVYAEKKAAGLDFTNGPCLAENLMPGWVADIAHRPRRRADELPENQCENYRNGTAAHFVELDPEGKVIRAW